MGASARIAILAAGAVLVSIVSPAYARDLTFEERVKAQEAIERVYYSHQTGATRRFEEAVPRGVLERKVRNYLKQNVALEKFWNTAVTREMLNKELERMARQTKMPARLNELYRALGNDSFLVKECLARPSLVDRLSRNFYDFDKRIHSEARRKGETIRIQLLDHEINADHEHPNRTIIDLMRVGPDRAERGPRHEPDLLANRDRMFARRELRPEEFDGWKARLPRRAGEVGPMKEDRESFVIPVTLESEPDKIRIAAFAVRKKPWEQWWDEVVEDLPVDNIESVATEDDPLPRPPDGAQNHWTPEKMALSEPSGNPGASMCASEDVWDNGSLSDIPLPRGGQTAVWTGSVMIIWGGTGNGVGPGMALDGGEAWRYDPATDKWTLASRKNDPGGHSDHVAVWTGSVMLVWGGLAANPQSGGRYDPISDTWKPTSTINAPMGTRFATAVWSGSRMLVWGGSDFIHQTLPRAGGVYDPESDTWTTMSTTNAPSGRYAHSAVWTGKEMIVWGGQDFTFSGYQNTGGRYDPSTNVWSPTSTVGAPEARANHSATWVQTSMVVWGGLNRQSILLNTGSRYDPETDSWVPVTMTNAPSGRWAHSAIWTGTRMVVWGGFSYYAGGHYYNTGALYDPSADAWSPVSTANAPDARAYHSTVWTGSLMIVWGGQAVAPGRVNTGGRYDPERDSWTPTSITGAPQARYGHTAIWTGNLMVVWGGQPVFDFIPLPTGGRYDPTMDVWTSTTTRDAPPGRGGHTAVWTGEVMVVWGGSDGSRSPHLPDSGGRYDPVANSWTPTSTIGAPVGRFYHAAVWTGSAMLVWGGASLDDLFVVTYPTAGGRYDPFADNWTPMSATNAPSGRTSHTAVWSGRSMVVWGGCNDVTCFNTGGRYDPEGDVWSATSTVGAPAPRYEHTAVWTGHLMLVWGGRYVGFHNTGGRYDPLTDRWLPTSTLNAPAATFRHTAIWTGDRMVVWGGNLLSNSGGRYDPVGDAWTPTSKENAPNGREEHTAVWTGTFMLIWGGHDAGFFYNTGGRYCACAVNTYYQDADGDGFGNPDVFVESCSAPPDYVLDAEDCDDELGAIHPEASETCNAVDDNCDERVDEGFGVGLSCTLPVDACHQVLGTEQCRQDGLGTDCVGPVGLRDGTPPVITCPTDIVLECPATMTGAGQASATDTCDTTPIVVSDAPAALPLGTTMVNWTATDASGNTTSCTQIVTVQDSTPPTLACPGPLLQECTSPEGAQVRMSASAEDACSPTITIVNNHTTGGADASGNYPLGTTVVTFRATDPAGNFATCSSQAGVRDTLPPSLTLATDPSTLWPPNHGLVPVRVGWQIHDLCDPNPAVVLSSVTSSEPDDAPEGEDGNTTGDIQDASPGIPDTQISLRAERMGDGPGRSYTLTYVSKDASGNLTSALGVAIVPHDLGKGPEPLLLNLEPGKAPGLVHVYWAAVDGAADYDVISGDLLRVVRGNGVTWLGPVKTMASGLTVTSYSEDVSEEMPALGHVLFYLVGWRDREGLGRGYGTESAQWPRQPGCEGGCSEPVASGGSQSDGHVR